jgi:hypothetical protein
MSDMLYFKNRRMVAKIGDITFEMSTLPPIEPLPSDTTEVYFYPTLSEYQLREKDKQPRLMRAPEIDAAFRFLATIAAFGRGLFNREASRDA